MSKIDQHSRSSCGKIVSEGVYLLRCDLDPPVIDQSPEPFGSPTIDDSASNVEVSRQLSESEPRLLGNIAAEPW